MGEKIGGSRGSLESGLLSPASTAALGGVHVRPSAAVLEDGAVAGRWPGELQLLGKHGLGPLRLTRGPVWASVAQGVRRLCPECDLMSLLAGGPGTSGWQEGRPVKSRPGKESFLSLPLPSCPTLGWLLTFSNPQFPHLSTREEGCDNYSLGAVRGLGDKTGVAGK